MEDPLAQAERHVFEFEARVVQQFAIIEALQRQGFEQQAELALELLETLQHSLDMARDHLLDERSRSGR